MARTEYVRRSFTVLAEEVTFENVHDVAKWCKGTVVMETTKLMGTETKLPVIVLRGQGDNRGKEFKATLGCFIVELKGSFRVYKNRQFSDSFEEKDAVVNAVIHDTSLVSEEQRLNGYELETDFDAPYNKHLEDGSCCDPRQVVKFMKEFDEEKESAGFEKLPDAEESA